MSHLQQLKCPIEAPNLSNPGPPCPANVEAAGIPQPLASHAPQQLCASPPRRSNGAIGEAAEDGVAVQDVHSVAAAVANLA